MAIITRFQQNTRGAIFLTGNSMGLSGNNGQPSATGNVGAWMTTSATLPTPTGWGAIVNLANNENVTLNWQENSSSAFLTLPTGAEVLYAELVWCSVIQNETQDLRASQNVSVNLMAPDGSTTSVAPDPSTSQTATITGPIVFMTRSNNITSTISQKGNGKYTVYGIPGARSGTSTCAAGWTIVVAYSLNTEPYRSLNIYTACEGISGSNSATVTITGFSTPRSGTVLSRALIGALEGDPNGSGDQALFGPNTSSLVALSGPRNPSGNFFQGQVCDNTGNLDLTGTFGTRNQALGTLSSGVRQGWDITNVDASGILPNNQTSAVFRFSSTAEVYAANMVSIQINVDSADLSTINKGGDKSLVKLGETILYTITIPNTGTTTATNVVFIDTIPNDTSFVSGSVIINGTPNSTANPQSPGFSIPDIAPSGINTVSFRILVNTVPSPNPIQNSAFVSYRFLPGITSTIPISTYNESNVFETTYIETPNLSSISKSVNSSFAKVGDILIYVITVPNTGDGTATNVVFTDTIPNGTTFVPNSVRINGVTQNGQVVSPPTGVTLPNIGANSFATLSFSVTVTTFPTPNPIPNSGTVKSTYTVDPTLGTTATTSGNTNFVYTQINTATITSTKSSSPANVLVGGIINYTIVLRNTGNTTAQNVVFTDTIPDGTSFIANSLKVNGVTNPNSPAPPTGVTISDMGPNAVQTITFSVTATTIPTPNPTPNTSTTNFNYVLNTITGGTIPSSSNSNTVTTYINPNSNPLKIVDKQYATLGDTLKYTIVWRNIISVTESNVTLVDTIPSGTTFVPGSITITGGSQTGTTITPPNGLNVGTVPVGSAVTVTFNVTVNTIPTVNPIPNEVTAGYDFISDPTLGTVTHDTSLSNTVTTQVNLATISSATKTVDKNFAKVGDILEYTVVFNNTGNVTANNIVLIDTIPSGTSFVINSVKINEVTQPGAVVAPTTGLSVGTLGSGVTTTVKFQVSVVTIPTTNPIPNTASVGYNFQVDPVQNINKGAQINTNTVNTRVNFADISSPVKTVNKAYSNIGDTLVYTIVLRNTGNVTATNIVFIDTIPNDTTLVPNTFKQDSTNISGSPNPPGVTLPNSLAPGTTSTITFNVTVNTIPSPNPIPNNASEYYSYIVDPTLNTTAIGSGNTNTVLTTVNNANLGNISKSVDKLYATCGDILTYTILVPNNGNVNATNVVLRDTIPSGTSLVSNSVTVNSVLQPSGTNPQTGINIGTIAAGTTVTVKFQVIVNC